MLQVELSTVNISHVNCVIVNINPGAVCLRWMWLMEWWYVSAADWMQGPYVYALYDNYGMSPYDINVLFVAGFGSSMVVGTAVGSFADR